MSVKKPVENHVEVDMVPLIDIVSLLLMFIVMVGDVSHNSSSVAMKLPRASESKSDLEWEKLGVDMRGRIVVQMVKAVGGGYAARVDNTDYALAPSGSYTKSLMEYLESHIQQCIAKNETKADPQTGAVGIPVKLRIPRDAPMFEVERVVMTLAAAKLVNVHYAANNKDLEE